MGRILEPFSKDRLMVPRPISTAKLTTYPNSAASSALAIISRQLSNPRLMTRQLWLCSDRFARQASKSADAQTGLADIMDALASKPEWGQNARMKTNDLAGRFVGVHHQVRLSYSIPQLQPLFYAPTDQFHVYEFSKDFHKFLLISFGEAK